MSAVNQSKLADLERETEQHQDLLQEGFAATVGFHSKASIAGRIDNSSTLPFALELIKSVLYQVGSTEGLPSNTPRSKSRDFNGR